MKKVVSTMQKKIALFMSIMLFIFVATGCQSQNNIAPNESAPATSGENEPLSISEVAANPREKVTEPEEKMVPEVNNDWELDTPENHGMDASLLEQLHNALAQTGIQSAVTVKDGYLIDEYYKDGYDENSVFHLASGTKSFTGALIGIAIDQGLISGVDATLSEFLPEYAGTDKANITIENFLTHTSGISWNEWSGGTIIFDYMQSENCVDFILKRSMVSEPGVTFNYNTGGSHMLSVILQKAIGETAYNFAVTNIFEPMGMDSVVWSTDPQGYTDGGMGVSMTPRDAAKFGQLYLDGGKWREQQIIPVEWVKLSTERLIPGADGTAAYGYQWWIRTCGIGSYETYYAMGASGQFIFVVPELDLITVMTSSLYSNTYAPRTYFIDYILAAVNNEEIII